MNVSFFTSRTATLPPRSRTGQRSDSRSRRRITQEDLDLFRALVGGPPQRLDAMKRTRFREAPVRETPEDVELIDLNVAEPAPAPRAPSAGLKRAAVSASGAAKRSTEAVRRSAVRCVEMAELCAHNIAVRVRRPQLAAWVQRISRDARQKMGEARSRLVSDPMARL